MHWDERPDAGRSERSKYSVHSPRRASTGSRREAVRGIESEYKPDRAGQPPGEHHAERRNRHAPSSLPADAERRRDPQERSDESARQGERDGFDEQSQDEIASAGADRHPHSEFARSFAERNEHDVHDADTADREGDRRGSQEQPGERTRRASAGVEDIGGVFDGKVVRRVAPQSMFLPQQFLDLALRLRQLGRIDHLDGNQIKRPQPGRMMPENGREQIRHRDAILFGSAGHPDIPDHITLWGLRLAICQPFDQYANVRPTRILPGITSPLRHVSGPERDWVIIRENSEGEYSGVGGRVHPGLPEEVATDVSIMTRAGVTRIMRFAFKLAQSRPRKLLTVRHQVERPASRHGDVGRDRS